MNVAIPLIAVAIIVAVTYGLIVVNLKAQQRNVALEWSSLDELRRKGLEAVPAFVAAVSADAARTEGALSSRHAAPLYRALSDVEQAAIASAQAKGARSAACADDALVQAIERVYAAADIDPDFVASANSRSASTMLDNAEHAIAHNQQIYNNAATIAANAQKSFPALLFAAHLGFSEPEPYESKAAARRAALDWTRRSLPSLADASPYLMNPHMLWASALADAVMDDRADEHAKRN